MNFNQKYIDICEKHKAVSSNVAILTNNIYSSYYYGHLSLEEQTNSTDKTIYRIASISKVIVAMGMMMLIEKKLANLEDDISIHLGYQVRNPNFIDTPITIKMLMLQTSSISDGPEVGLSGYNAINRQKDFVKLIDVLSPTGSHYTPETFLKVEPGTKFSYSNFGCGILACLIEKISGVYFTDYIERVLFKPLNLDASFKITNIFKKELIASSYQYVENHPTLVLSRAIGIERMFPRYELGSNFRGPAGGLYTSMLDLAKIMSIFINDGTYDNKRFLKKKTINDMYKIHWQGQGTELYRAKGLQLIVLDGFTKIPLRGHFGNAYGIRSFMLFSKEAKKGICFITSGAIYHITNKGMSSFQEDMIKLFVDTYQL